MPLFMMPTHLAANSGSILPPFITNSLSTPEQQNQMVAFYQQMLMSKSVFNPDFQNLKPSASEEKSIYSPNIQALINKKVKISDDLLKKHLNQRDKATPKMDTGFSF